MKNYDTELTQKERALRTAYLKQPVPQPSSQWHESLRQQIRTTPTAWTAENSTWQNRTLRTMAWATALAALLAVILNFITIPSPTQTAWNLNRDRILSTWDVSQTGQ